MSETISPTEVARFVMSITPKLLDVIGKLIERNRTLDEQLQQLDRKIDQIFLREIRSSFQTILGVNTISSPEMRERHLLAAEENLLKNVALDPTLTTAGERNSAWNARSLFGLSCIAALRGEAEDATHFLLQAFVADPREMRATLATEVFHSFIEPRCNDIREQAKSASKCLPEAERKAKELHEKIRSQRVAEVGGGILGAAVVGLFPGVGAPVAAAAANAYSSIEGEIKGLKAELAALPTVESIQEESEKAIDDRCREFAQALLDHKTWDVQPKTQGVSGVVLKSAGEKKIKILQVPRDVTQDLPEAVFDVVLKSASENKINVLAVVRRVTNLGLKEAKDLVESAPVRIQGGVSREVAEWIRKKLEAAGATVEVNQVNIPPPGKSGLTILFEDATETVPTVTNKLPELPNPGRGQVQTAP